MKAIPMELNLQSIEKPLLFEKNFEFDLLLPEQLPNIKESLCIDTQLISQQIIYDNEKNTVQFKLLFRFLYISDLNNRLEVYTFEHVEEYKPDVKMNDNISYIFSAQTTSPTIRTLNPRKIFVKSKLIIQCTKVTTQKISTISDNQLECCIKSESVSSSSINEYILDEFTLEDDLTFGEGYDPIDRIIDTIGHLSSVKCEFVDGYTILKGNIILSFLYASEIDPEKIIHAERSISFEKSIPCTNFEEGIQSISDLRIINIKATPQIDTYGEYRSINVETKIKPIIIAISDIYNVAVTDIFSPNYKELITNQCVGYTKLGSPQEKYITFEGIINTKDSSLQRIISSYTNGEISFSNDNEKFDGKVTINIIGKGEDGYKCIQFQKEFEESFTVTPILYKFEITDCNISISGANNFSYKIIGKITTLCGKEDNINIVNDVVFLELESPKEKMIIYYPSKDESIWNIAKKYHISIDKLKSSNSILDNEHIDTNKIIVINKL